jgi:NAD-dependent DNA ligase
MNKLLALMMAGCFALTVAGAAVAEEPKAPAAAPAAKEAPAKKAAGKVSKVRVITGAVESVDAAAGTLAVKGRKETVTLKAAEGVKLDEIKVGDKVTVTFRGDALSKVVKAKARAAKDCKNCPNDNNCKDCPKGSHAGKATKGGKAAKADKACKECPQSGAAPKK